MRLSRASNYVLVVAGRFSICPAPNPRLEPPVGTFFYKIQVRDAIPQSPYFRCCVPSFYEKSLQHIPNPFRGHRLKPDFDFRDTVVQGKLPLPYSSQSPRSKGYIHLYIYIHIFIYTERYNPYVSPPTLWDVLCNSG